MQNINFTVNYDDIKITNFLLAPKMCQTLVYEMEHRRKIDNIRTYIKSNNNQLPGGKNIILSCSNGFLQVHDGNHRLLALALENPSVKYKDIKEYVYFIHDQRLNEKREYYFHIYTNQSDDPTIKLEEYYSYEHGKVKRAFTTTPIFFRDPDIFKKDENWEHGVDTSFGLTIGNAVQAINNHDAIDFSGQIELAAHTTIKQIAPKIAPYRFL